MVESTNTFSQQMHLPFLLVTLIYSKPLMSNSSRITILHSFFSSLHFFVCKFIRVTGLMNIQNSFEHVQTLDINQCHFVLT